LTADRDVIPPAARITEGGAMAHADPEPSVSWVPNRKIVAAVVTNILTAAVALAVSRLGLHVSSGISAEVGAAIGIVAGAVAGYLVKEAPVIERDIAAQP
jgi:hypothetical protein